MMMDTAVQQQTDSNGQIIVTPHERQALIQRLYKKDNISSYFFVSICIELRDGR